MAASAAETNGKSRLHPRGGAALLALLALMACLSQFYRVANSVIAPELMRDLGLTAPELGLAGGAFFVLLLAAQIPVGIWFDRYGARLTLSILTIFAIVGAVLMARAGTAADLIVARCVIGLGCAANFMAVVFLCARWFPGERYTTTLSLVFALSNIGTLAAATPLALSTAAIGWRGTFLGLGAFTALSALLFYAIVRDDPPGKTTAAREPETIREIGAGLMEVWRTPGLLPVWFMHIFPYATQLTVLGVWAGPYLFDVHGLGAIERGHVLFALGLAQIAGVLCYGPLDRVLGSRKRVVVIGALLLMAALTALALVVAPPLWLAIAMLVAATLVASYGVVIVSQGRSLFPDHLVGRGVTTVNMAQVLGLVLLPSLSGYVVGAFMPAGSAGGAVPEHAYRVLFGGLALGNLLGLLIYLRSRDSRPHVEARAA
jgi:MFS family permease